MKFWIDIYCICFNKSLSCFEVTFRLDALDLSKEVTEETAKCLEVVYYNICLAITYLLLDNIVCKTLLIAPVSDELTVLHMSLSILLTKLDTSELSKHTIAYKALILCLISLHIRKDSELHELWISKIIKTEKIGTCLFQS